MYQDITNDDDRTIYELRTYTSDYKLNNHFVFDKEEGNNKIFYEIKYDSIQFSQDSIIGIDLNSVNSDIDVCNYYEKVSEILKPYEIKSLIKERGKINWGLDLRIYFEGGGILEYYSNGKEDPYPSNYKYKQINENWYFLKT